MSNPHENKLPSRPVSLSDTGLVLMQVSYICLGGNQPFGVPTGCRGLCRALRMEEMGR
jgi:hypothetical protein